MFYLLNISWNLKKRKKREKEILNPEVNRVEKKNWELSFLSSCIHSFTNKYGRVYAGALLVNTFGGIKTQITFHMLIFGELFRALISQVHALSS